MSDEPLIHWPQPLFELAGFLASFLATGAIGFRYGVMRRLGRPGTTEMETGGVHDRALRRAAVMGWIGVALASVLLLQQIPETAAERHVPALTLLTRDAMTMLRVATLLIAMAGFVVAWRGRRLGWRLAALGVVVGALRAALLGAWSRLINPIHVLAGGLWIGTLLVMVVAGLTTVLTSELSAERRGAVAAAMVQAFSPLALGSASVLVVFGVITAWRHLVRLQALWTTPYGYALITKLCMVAVVAALGAWNWRRQRPRMGTESGAAALRRSATAELIAASVVLAITAILVSLPSPPRH